MQRPDPATAIIASDGLIGLSVVEAIHELGLSIPEDVSFLMYDDFAWTRLTTPPLTVIAQPVYDMGVAAASALIRQIEGRKAPAAAPTFTAAADPPRLGRGPAGAGTGQGLVLWRGPGPADSLNCRGTFSAIGGGSVIPVGGPIRLLESGRPHAAPTETGADPSWS